ncbi:MAG: zinc ribbon domain-containing protein, partial [Pseudomonadota bacterium]|nr:zinc ribbon domain-containing protein [Pseudomonadota bacterium]
IIEQALWDEVQAKLTQNAAQRSSGKNARNPSLLAGRVFDASGRPLTPSHSNKNGRRYRYYVSQDRNLRLPAAELEIAVENALRSDRELTLHFQQHETGERYAVDLIKRVVLKDASIRIELNRGHAIEADYTLRRRGVERKLVLNGAAERKPDLALVKRVHAAMNWLDQIKLGRAILDIAKEDSVSPEYITHNLGLSMLSPKILQAIASGAQRRDVSAYQLSKITIPTKWRDQESIFLEQF